MVSPEVSSPVAGDVVAVQWGLDTVEATVVSVYATGLGLRVTVSVPILGPAGEQLDETVLTLPIEAIHSPAA